MEALKELLDSLRSSVYTILSLLLPGCMIVYLAQSLLPERFRFPPRIAGFLVAAYVAGLAAQGFGSGFSAVVKIAYKKIKGNISVPVDVVEPIVKEIIDKTLNVSIPSEAIFNVALSAVHDRREIYDRFTALRDMCRGLVVACAVALVVLVVRRGEFSTEAFWGSMIALVLASLGLIERFYRFSPLPKQIVFGQFIAAQLKQPKSEEAK